MGAMRRGGSLKTSAAPRVSRNGWEGVLTSFVHPLNTGYFTAHITRNWGRLKSFFEKSFDLVSYQVI